MSPQIQPLGARQPHRNPSSLGTPGHDRRGKGHHQKVLGCRECERRHRHIQTADTSLEQKKGVVPRCSWKEGKEDGEGGDRGEGPCVSPPAACHTAGAPLSSVSARCLSRVLALGVGVSPRKCTSELANGRHRDGPSEQSQEVAGGVVLSTSPRSERRGECTSPGVALTQRLVRGAEAGRRLCGVSDPAAGSLGGSPRAVTGEVGSVNG